MIKINFPRSFSLESFLQTSSIDYTLDEGSENLKNYNNIPNSFLAESFSELSEAKLKINDISKIEKNNMTSVDMFEIEDFFKNEEKRDNDDITLDEIVKNFKFIFENRLFDNKILEDNLKIIIKILKGSDYNKKIHKNLIKATLTCTLKNLKKLELELKLIDFDEFYQKCQSLIEGLETENNFQFELDFSMNSFREEAINYLFRIKDFEEKKYLISLMID